MLVMLFAMQAVPQAVEVVTLPDPATDTFELARARPSAPENRCSRDQPGGDIVICARTKAMDYSGLPEFTDRPVRAGADLPGGGRVAVEGESRNVGGFTSKAAMVKVKIPF